MTSVYLDENPHLLAKWSSSNPLGRIGRSAEMRGVAVWLASSASSFWYVVYLPSVHTLTVSLHSNGSDIVVSGGHQIW